MSRQPVRGAARLAAILDALPDALLLVDAAGTVVNANAMALEALEVNGTALVGSPLASVLPSYGNGYGGASSTPALPGGTGTGTGTGSAPAQTQAQQQGAPAADGPVRSRPVRYPARRTDGSVFPAEVSSTALPGEDGGLTLFVIRDLSNSLDVEAELRRQQRQTELILRASNEGVIGVDAFGHIVLANPAAARILRYRASDLGGKDLHQLLAYAHADGTPVAPDDCQILETLRTARRYRLHDEVLWRKDGTPVYVDVSVTPVNEGDSVVGAVMTFTDTSELRAVARRGDELVGVLDERLRTPLSVVRRDIAELTGRRIGEVGPEARRLLTRAVAELDGFAELLNDVVDYQRVVAEQEAVERHQTDLAELVRDVVDEVADAAAGMGIEVTLHVEPAAVTVDQERVAQAVRYLLVDTVESSSAGATVVVAAARREALARIEIRGPLTGARPLHLSIARAIVERQSGTITTHRIAGKGHTYVIEVPVDGDAAARRAARPAVAEPAPQVVKTNGHSVRHGATSRHAVSTQPAAIPRQTVRVEPTAMRRPEPPEPDETPAVEEQEQPATGLAPVEVAPEPDQQPQPPSQPEPEPQPATPEPRGRRRAGSAVATVGPNPTEPGPNGRSPAQNPAEPAPADQAPADSAHTDQARTDSAHTEQAHVGQTRAGQAHAGQAHAGQPHAGEPHAGQAQAGSAHAGQAQAGSAHAGQAQAGSAHAGQAQVEPARTEQAQAEQARAEQARAEQAQARQARAGQVGAQPASAEEPAQTQAPARAQSEAADDESDEDELATGRRLLVWPQSDPETARMLAVNGYRPLVVPASGIPADLVGKQVNGHQDENRPVALFVDPIAAPITRRGLRTLRAAAAEAKVPVLVTAGLGEAAPGATFGPEPATLLGVLNPAAETPRVLLVEARDEVARAFIASLDRSGMEVLHAASESDGVTTAANNPPDLVVMDLMLVRRRRMGVVDWLRAHERLAQTPVVVYTADGIASANGSRPGGGSLYLAERSAAAEAQQRIVDLLSKITATRYA